jgi:hypothetical protein
MVVFDFLSFSFQHLVNNSLSYLNLQNTNKKTDDGEYSVYGNLTLRGVTKPETFAVSFEGMV